LVNVLHQWLIVHEPSLTGKTKKICLSTPYYAINMQIKKKVRIINNICVKEVFRLAAGR